MKQWSFGGYSILLVDKTAKLCSRFIPISQIHCLFFAIPEAVDLVYSFVVKFFIIIFTKSQRIKEHVFGVRKLRAVPVPTIT